MRPVEHLRRGRERDDRQVGVEDVLRAVRGELRALGGEAQEEAAVERQHVVLAGLHPPARDHLAQLLGVLGGEVVRLGRVLGDVEQLPAVRVQLVEHLGRDVVAELAPELALPRRSSAPASRRPRASRRGRSRAGRTSRSTACGAASGTSASSNVCAKLTPSIGDCVTPRIASGGSMPSASRTVGTMSMACAYWVRISPRALDAGRPVDDERVGRAAAVDLLLPAPERGVAGPRPAPRVVVVRPACRRARRSAAGSRRGSPSGC